MKRLSTPLRDSLDGAVDLLTTHRIWQGVATRRDRGRRFTQRLSLATAFSIGVLAALVVALMARPRTSDGPRAQEAPDEPLKLMGGMAFGPLEAATDERVVDFDDGSRVTLEPRARLEPLENAARSVVLHLAAGKATFDVRPGGRRRWSIEAGLATVEVVGTRFSIGRGGSRLVVAVERGIVLVRGERVADRIRQLGAGERLQIDAEPITQPMAAPLGRTSGISGGHHAVPDGGSAAETSWQDRAKRGDYVEAYRELGANGIAESAKTADIDQLLALADVARLSGHAAAGVEPLERVLAEHSRDPRAALAAFTLGRLQLDSLADAPAAARAFQRAMALQLPDALVEDTHLRLIEARARAGDRSGAHDAWTWYVEHFANSPRRTIADRWGRDP
jgi:transmembrane sensor